jgi:hypothetical protein
MTHYKPALPSCDGTEMCRFVSARVSWTVTMIYGKAEGVFHSFLHCLLQEVNNYKNSLLSHDKLCRHCKPQFSVMD